MASGILEATLSRGASCQGWLTSSEVFRVLLKITKQDVVVNTDCGLTPYAVRVNVCYKRLNTL
jgi:hypothetical protein